MRMQIKENFTAADVFRMSGPIFIELALQMLVGNVDQFMVRPDLGRGGGRHRQRQPADEYRHHPAQRAGGRDHRRAQPDHRRRRCAAGAAGVRGLHPDRRHWRADCDPHSDRRRRADFPPVGGALRCDGFRLRLHRHCRRAGAGSGTLYELRRHSAQLWSGA